MDLESKAMAKKDWWSGAQKAFGKKKFSTMEKEPFGKEPAGHQRDHFAVLRLCPWWVGWRNGWRNGWVRCPVI